MSTAVAGEVARAASLDALLAAERARVRAALRLAVSFGVGAVVLAGLAAAGLALGGGRWLVLPALAPVLAWLCLALAAGALAVAARPRVQARAADDVVARAVERERALRAGSLRAAREVAAAGPLGARAADALARQLGAGGGALAPAWLAGARRLAGASAWACGAGLVALGGSTLLAGDGVRALAHPVAAARGTLLPTMRVLGAPARVARGRPLVVTVEAPGRRRVRAAWRVAGRAWVERELALGSDGRAALPLGAVDADLALVVSDGRARTDTVRVRVEERPFVGDVSVRAEFPAYLGRASEVLPAGDVLRVPRGTTLLVSARASGRLARAALVGPGGVVALEPAGALLSARLTPNASGRWAWDAADARGPADAPAPLDVALVADSTPVVTIVTPATDSAIDGLATVAVHVRAGDDHGLARVTLRTTVERAAGGREPAATTPLAGGVGPAWEGDAVVRPEAMRLAPGDRVRVQALAVDASPWAQAGASRELVLRVPGGAELRAAARRAADSAAAGASSAAAAARSLAERTGDAARARDAGGSGANGAKYQAAERARGLAAEQRQLGARVADVREQAAALERRLRQSGALDSSLARQLADVQRLLRDALTPELAAQLADVERAAGQQGAGGAGMSASLEQLAARQRALREQLEQSGEMLRRAALEGAMQTLRDDARELATAQARAAERLARQERGAASNAEPAESPAALAESARTLSADVDSLGRRLARAQAEAGSQRAGAAARDAARSAAAMARAAAPERSGREEGGRDGQRAGAPAPVATSAERGAQGKSPGAEGRAESGMPNGGAANPAASDATPNAKAPGANESGTGAPNTRTSVGDRSGAEGQSGRADAGARAQSARDAAGAMREAAERLADARRQQVDAWKNELGAALDRAAQEAQQLAREQQQLARDARDGARDPASLRSAQAAVQQGAEQAARRVEQAGRQSSLLSQRARRAMADARQEVGEAARALQQGGQQGAQQGGQSSTQPGGGSPGTSSGSPGGDAPTQMREAGDALARAASALVRDRERVRGAASSTGFEEMVAQMRQLAGQQGQINQQAGGLPIPVPGAAGQGARDAARRLARQQRGVAERLGELGDANPSGRSDALAGEARQLAQALERQAAPNATAPDPSTIARQQQLYRKMLEAGRTLEQDERDDQGKREARSGAGVAAVAPATGVESGRAGARYALPAWGDLRALSAEERRLVTEYFRRLNGGTSGTPTGGAGATP